MAEQKNSPETQEEKKLKQLRDLKLKKDVRGGAQIPGHTDKRPPVRSGEIDFMNWD